MLCIRYIYSLIKFLSQFNKFFTKFCSSNTTFYSMDLICFLVLQVTGALGGGRCQLLGSLDANLEMITSNVIWLTRGAMQGIRKTSDVSMIG